MCCLETVAARKLNDVSIAVQSVARGVRAGHLNNAGCHWERLGSQQQPALFNITTLISTLGDYPRAPRSHAAYSNQAHSTEPPLLGPPLAGSGSPAAYKESFLAGVDLSTLRDLSLLFSGPTLAATIIAECISGSECSLYLILGFYLTHEEKLLQATTTAKKNSFRKWHNQKEFSCQVLI